MPRGKIKTFAVQRTYPLLNQWGWPFWNVESYNAFSGRKNDLFGIIDIVAITNFSTIGVQVCSGDFSEHVKKITLDEIDNTINWLSCPNRKLLLIGWRKVLKRKGMKLKIYKPRIAWFYIQGEDLVLEEKETDWYGQ